jgi:Rab proteins geranylgeranyltransferase component A
MGLTRLETSKIFRDVLSKRTDPPVSKGSSVAKLSSPRSYSLALAPHVLYADSALIKLLVSSKIYRQLEFLALGAWWLYSKPNPSDTGSSTEAGSLIKVPTSREDVAFSTSSSIDMRSRRLVMKILRFVVDYETQGESWEPYAEKPFALFLTEHFKVKSDQQSTLVDLFLGLTLSVQLQDDISTRFALERIARHIRCIGRLGPGFNAVVPKWGGLAEVTQVACRACAVGGGTYMLGTGIAQISRDEDGSMTEVSLTNGDLVKAKFLVGDEDGSYRTTTLERDNDMDTVYRSIFVVSSSLRSLLPPVSDGIFPAGTVVVFPPTSLSPDSPTTYLIVHASETGECPNGQSKYS